MRQLALRTLRFRLGAFVAAFLAIFCAATIMMACGGLIETGIRTAVPPQQLSSADIVVAGEQAYHAADGDPDEPVILPERVRIDATLEGTIAGLPGVRSTESHVFDGRPPAGRVDAIGVRAEPGADLDELREQIESGLDEQTTTLVGDERGQAELREARETGVNVPAGWQSRSRTPLPQRQAGSRSPASPRHCATSPENEHAGTQLTSRSERKRPDRTHRGSCGRRYSREA